MCVAAVAALAVSLHAGLVRADDDDAAPPAEVDGPATDTKTEVTALPLAGGDSDIGVGGGFILSLARTHPFHQPYRWRLESVGLITFKGASDGGGVDVPFQDYYVKLTVPHALGEGMRIELRPSLNWLSTIKYYGLGNASVQERAGVTSPRDFEYARINPAIRLSARLAMSKHVFANVGAAFVYNFIDVAPTSVLAADMANGSPQVRALLGTARDHAVLSFEPGLAYDNRDQETSPTKGMFHSVTLRLAPGATNSEFRYRWGSLNAAVRFYLPLFTPRLVFALRVVGDGLFGTPPFYELARFEDSYAIGGVNGVRGVPAQRYYGKAKVFGNAELRADLFGFRLFEKKFRLGAVGFFDGGRVWADYREDPVLDGTGIGLKYGVGGGLRLASGDTFVIRGDVAWSPDARPIGAYFAAGQMF